MEVRGAVVVVTGAGAGIGRALCERFAADGAAHVVAADLDREAACETARRIGGEAVTPHGVDVSDAAAVAGLIEDAWARQGAIDLYCSNAGVLVRGGVEADLEGWQRSWEVNVLAHLFAARALLPRMLQRGRGHLLATISAAGLLNQIGALPYGVTKSAGLSLMEWLSITYGDRGLGFSCLCPQGVRTAMLRDDDFLGEGALTPEQVATAAVQGLRDERFLILPHPEVAEYFRRRASDPDRWLRGMRRLRARVDAHSLEVTT